MTASLQQLEALFTEAAALPAVARAEFSLARAAAMRNCARGSEGMLRTNDTLAVS